MDEMEYKLGKTFGSSSFFVYNIIKDFNHYKNSDYSLPVLSQKSGLTTKTLGNIISNLIKSNIIRQEKINKGYRRELFINKEVEWKL